MEKATMLTVSTGAVSENTRWRLDAAVSDPDALSMVVYPKGEFGWFVYIPEEPVLSLVKGPADCPADLLRLVHRAQCEGAGLLCLDRDGPEPDSDLGPYQVSVLGSRKAGKTSLSHALALRLGACFAENGRQAARCRSLGLPVVLDGAPGTFSKDTPDIRVYLDAAPLERAMRLAQDEEPAGDPEDVLRAAYDPDREGELLSTASAQADRFLYLDNTKLEPGDDVQLLLTRIRAYLEDLEDGRKPEKA